MYIHTQTLCQELFSSMYILCPVNPWLEIMISIFVLNIISSRICGYDIIINRHFCHMGMEYIYMKSMKSSYLKKKSVFENNKHLDRRFLKISSRMRDDPHGHLKKGSSSFLAHLAKGHVSFCHHVSSVVCRRRLS